MQYVLCHCLLFLILFAFAAAAPTFIVGPEAGAEQSQLEDLALKDARRYVGLLTGEAPTLVQLNSAAPLPKQSVYFATVGRHAATHALLLDWDQDGAFALALNSLDTPDSHLLHTFQNGAMACIGASERATLYASYALAEELGARFFIDNDVLPQPSSLALVSVRSSGLRKVFSPAFQSRGLQPFMNFYNGPSWWTTQNFQALATQMAKLKLNYWAFHTYPLRQNVWIGVEGAFDPNTGEVPVNPNVTYGNGFSKVTGATSFCCGAAQLFSRDCFSNDIMTGRCQNSPVNQAAWVNLVAAQQREAFGFARDVMGVETSLGIEFPLTLPSALVKANTTLLEAYTGMFKRLVAAKIPISSFWLWSSETIENHQDGKGKTNQSDPMWHSLVEEIQIAQVSSPDNPIHPV